MAQLTANNVAGVLASAITNSATSIPLASAAGFPVPTGGDYLLVTLVGVNSNGQEGSWEIVKCTAISASTLTVVRAQESTAALAWGAGTRCEMRLTAGFVGNLFATPPAIGSTTPAAASFTTLSASGAATVTGKVTATGGFAGAIDGPVGAVTPASGSFTTVTTSGSVGVGTSTPTVALDVVGAVKATAGFIGAHNGTVGATTPATGAFTIVNTTGGVNAGDNTQIINLSARGNASGSGGGSSINAQAGGNTIVAIGNRSAILGGAYDGSSMIFASSALSTYIGGVGVATVLDASGNLGLGVTPSAWGASYRVLEQLGGSLYSSGSGYLALSQNIYNNGASNLYRNTAAASIYQQTGGAHSWLNAPSGTSGSAISFTQAMTLDAGGNLGIGAAAGLAGLDVYRTLVGQLATRVKNDSGSGAASVAYILDNGTVNASILLVGPGNTGAAGANSLNITTSGANPIAFSSGGSERARLDASGNLLVGTASGGGKLTVRGASVNTALLIDNVGSGENYYASNSFQEWQTAGTAKMRLDINGNLLVGTTAATARLVTQVVSSNASAAAFTNIASPTVSSIVTVATTQVASATAYALTVQSGNGSTVTTNNLFIYTNGNVSNANNSYGGISDAKLKENIIDATPKLNHLMDVRIVNYNLINDPDHKQLGVIAQELEQVFPGMVEESPDMHEVTKQRQVDVAAVVDEEGNVVEPATTKTEDYTEREPTGTVTKSVKYSVFVPMLIKGMQEQQAMIAALTARLAALEAA